LFHGAASWLRQNFERLDHGPDPSSPRPKREQGHAEVTGQTEPYARKQATAPHGGVGRVLRQVGGQRQGRADRHRRRQRRDLSGEEAA
jgi:hypothetical protein